MDPLDFPAHLRAEWEAGPRLLVVVLAASGDTVGQVACLDLEEEACPPRDDPGRLLWAQVKALLRRAPAAAGEAGILRAGALAFDRRAMTVRLGERVEGLTPHEFDCAWLLAGNAGAVVTRGRLREAMTRGAAGAIRDRTVDACISRLRRKLLGLDGRARRIRSVRGQGYLLDPAA